MANKTVRILRTLPFEGVVYRANDLVIFSDEQLKIIDPTAVDGSKAAVDYCKGQKVQPVKCGEDPRAKKPAEPEPAQGEEAGELTE